MQQKVEKNYFDYPLNEYYLLYKHGNDEELMQICKDYFNKNQNNDDFTSQHAQIILLILIKHQPDFEPFEKIQTVFEACLQRYLNRHYDFPIQWLEKGADKIAERPSTLRTPLTNIVDRIKNLYPDDKFKTFNEEFDTKLLKYQFIKNFEKELLNDTNKNQLVEDFSNKIDHLNQDALVEFAVIPQIDAQLLVDIPKDMQSFLRGKLADMRIEEKSDFVSNPDKLQKFIIDSRMIDETLLAIKQDLSMKEVLDDKELLQLLETRIIKLHIDKKKELLSDPDEFQKFISNSSLIAKTLWAIKQASSKPRKDDLTVNFSIIETFLSQIKEDNFFKDVDPQKYCDFMKETLITLNIDKKKELLSNPTAWQNFINWIKESFLRQGPQSTQSYVKSFRAKLKAEEAKKALSSNGQQH